ncbi:hypothetical protein AMTR_s00093p00090340 [Amborella trichopoda]|uniref:uroporphyrinogen-III C-methyltransferase n=1 Tax=Amborella trichopoda TaxID=13333 RepID=W1NSV0_AMBTC|nr:hypothetical protein AMTR_s00093p00090340 [Amborella trichopoda]
MATVFKLTPPQISTFHQNASKTNILHHLDSPNRLTGLPISIPRSSTPRTSPFTEKHSVQRYERDQWLARRAGEGGGRRERPGSVYLVGTGPGDPELLTVKALRVNKSANLVLYDRLVSNDIMDWVQPNAKMLYVGKTAGYHSRTQDEIHELLLSFAEVGATVVRLKGGYLLIFGRGGEEMDFLQQQGIHIKVIPRITAASGIAAELGIPLTHHGVANSIRFLTRHSRKGGSSPLFIEENAATPDTTLIMYMGLSTLPSLALNLIHRDGLPPDTPSVAVERGTTPQQRKVFAELKIWWIKLKQQNWFHQR